MRDVSPGRLLMGENEMEIRYVSGNIFASTAQVLVVPVNCEGVAGKGLALQFKERYPRWFHVYQLSCQMGLIQIGRPMLDVDLHPIILRFPTKAEWRKPSHLDYIESGLAATADLLYNYSSVESIAFPKLGTGLGGLVWEEVQTLMDYYLGLLRCDVTVYV